MVWASKKVKIGWIIFCYGLVVVLLSYSYSQGNLSDEWYKTIPLLVLGALGFLPTEKGVRAGITKESLIAEFGLREVISEEGKIYEKRVVNGDREFELVDTDGGYTFKTIRKMIAKHSGEVKGKVVVIRTEAPSLCRGAAFPNFGLYIETGRKVVKK